MATVAHLTEQIIRKRPFLQEALARGIINYGALADELIGEIQSQLEKKVRHAAVMMALRRYSEKIISSKLNRIPDKVNPDLSIRSNMFKMTVVKTKDNISRAKKVLSLIPPEETEKYNIAIGSREITLITHDRHEEKLVETFEKQDIVSRIKGLSSLSINFSKKLIQTPGFYYMILRELAWENINLIEMVSTSTELNLIIKDEEVGQAFTLLNNLFQVR